MRRVLGIPISYPSNIYYTQCIVIPIHTIRSKSIREDIHDDCKAILNDYEYHIQKIIRHTAILKRYHCHYHTNCDYR